MAQSLCKWTAGKANLISSAIKSMYYDAIYASVGKWEIKFTSRGLSSCILSNPPNRCFHRRNFAFQENCILFIRQVSFPGSFYCIFPRRRMIHFLVFGGHVGALTQFFYYFSVQTDALSNCLRGILSLLKSKIAALKEWLEIKKRVIWHTKWWKSHFDTCIDNKQWCNDTSSGSKKTKCLVFLKSL